MLPDPILRIPDAATPAASRRPPYHPLVEPLRAAEEVVDAINRAIDLDVPPRRKIEALLRDYQKLIDRDHDVQLILHDELSRKAGPRVVERVTIGPRLETIEPRPDAEVQAFIDAAAPAVRMIMPDVLQNLREPRVFVVSQDLPVTYGGWFQRELVDKFLSPHGWNDLMIAVWASGPDSMIGMTTYGRPDLPPFGPPDRRLASLVMRAAAPMLYRELFGSGATLAAADANGAGGGEAFHNPMVGRDLSERQRDVLLLLLRGHSEKEVAAALGVSTHTVHTHVKRLYTEFDVSSRGELLALFVDQRLLHAAAA